MRNIAIAVLMLLLFASMAWGQVDDRAAPHRLNDPYWAAFALIAFGVSGLALGVSVGVAVARRVRRPRCPRCHANRVGEFCGNCGSPIVGKAGE